MEVNFNGVSLRGEGERQGVVVGVENMGVVLRLEKGERRTLGLAVLLPREGQENLAGVVREAVEGGSGVCGASGARESNGVMIVLERMPLDVLQFPPRPCHDSSKQPRNHVKTEVWTILLTTLRLTQTLMYRSDVKDCGKRRNPPRCFWSHCP